MKNLQCLPLIGLCAALISTDAEASLLNLSPNPNAPDFFSSSIAVSYNASTRHISAQGYTTDYQNGSATLNPGFDYGLWELTAVLSADFTSLVGGSVAVRGNLDGVGDDNELLLSGNLRTGAAGAVFGFEDGGGDLFEFLFEVTGGTLMGDFLAWGNVGGIILDAGFAGSPMPFTGSWNSDFHNVNLNGTAQTFVPEPSDYGLMVSLMAALGLIVARNRPSRTVAKSILSANARC